MPSFVAGTLHVQLHMGDKTDLIADGVPVNDIAILNVWGTDCHLEQ